MDICLSGGVAVGERVRFRGFHKLVFNLNLFLEELNFEIFLV